MTVMFSKSITPEQIVQLPLASFEGEITVIDKLGKEFAAAVRYLKSKKVIGFDTESRPCFSAREPRYGVSLLQLSGAERAFLFRIKMIGMHPALCRILSSPDIIKVGAAVKDDIMGLQRYRKFNAMGFVDLQQTVWEWGILDKSVKKMAAVILGLRISKSQQLSNWEAPELSEPQTRYAATDAWVCREMYIKLLGCEKHPLTWEEMHPQIQKDEK